MARKLNKKVIALIVGVPVTACLVAGGGYMARKMHLFQPSVATLEKQGDEAWASGNYIKAKDLFGSAASRSKTDVPLQIKFVDAFDYCVNGDPDAYRTLRSYYAMIHTQDPRNVEVMRRMLKMQIADVRNSPGNQSNIRTLQSTADSILKQVTGNSAEDKAAVREARKARLVAVIEPWQRQFHVEAEDLNAAKIDVEKLYQEDPNDGEVIFLTVRFLMQQIADAYTNGSQQQFRDLLDVSRRFVDDAIKKTPENPDAYFAAYHIYRGLARSLPDKEVKPEKKLEMMKMADGFLEKADEFAKPTMSVESFLTIRTFYLRVIELHDRKLASERYKQLITELPNSRVPRVMYAKFLAQSPDTIEEAIKVLTAPYTPQKQFKAIESMEVRGQEIIETLRLQVIRLTSLELIKDEQKRVDRLKEVEDAYKLLATYPTMPQAWMRRIEAGIAIQHDHVSEAVDKLEDALRLLSPDSPSGPEQELYNEILIEDAIAQIRLGQTGKARPKLFDLTQRDPLNIRAQLKLLEIYISERDRDSASALLQKLKSILTQTPMLDQYEVAILNMYPEQLAEKYKSMKEETRQQKLMKLRLAMSIGNAQSDDAIRIGRDLVAANSKDEEAIQLLFRSLLILKNDREAALAVIEQASKDNPGNERYADIVKTMKLNPGDQDKFMFEKFNEIEDPFERHMMLAGYYQQQGKFEEAITEAKAAQKDKPSRVEAIDMEFSVLVQQKKFKEADAMLERFDQLGDPAGNELRKIRLLIAKSYEQPNEDDRLSMINQARRQAALTAQKYKDIAAVTLLYAQLLHDAKEYSDAAEQYQLTLNSSPTNMEALLGLIRCQIASNRINEAKALIEKNIAKFPGNKELNQLKQEFEISFGDPQLVLDSIQANLKKNEQNPTEWMRYGVALEQVGNRKIASKEVNEANQFYTRASKHWALALEKFPTDLRFAVHQTRMKQLLRDTSGAEAVMETFVKNPSNATKTEAIEALAELYTQNSKLPQAEKTLKDFVTSLKEPPTTSILKLSYLYMQMKKSEEALAILDLKKDDPQVIRHRIELLISMSRFDEARTQVDSEIARKPNPDLYLLRGFIELRNGDNNKALLFFDKVLAERPKDVSALFYRSQILLNQMPPNIDGAREDLETAMQADPNNINIFIGLADVYTKNSDKTGAINALEKAWALSNRTNKDVYMRLFTAYLEAVPPRTLDAQRLLESVREVSTLVNDPDVMLTAARLAFATSNVSKGVEQAKKAVETSNGNPSVIRQYFDLLYKAKQFRQLLSESDPIIQKTPDLWWLHQIRGQAYRALEQRADSGKAFDAAMATLVKSKDIGALYELTSTIADTLGIQEAVKRVDPIAGSDNNLRLLQANLLQRAGQFEKAIEILQRIRAEKGSLSTATFNSAMNLLGSTCLQVFPKQTSEALKVYEELLKDNPDDVLLLNNLSFVHIMNGSGGSMERALAHSARAYELSRAMPVSDIRVKYVEDTRGWVLYKSGKVNEGLDMLQQASIRAKFPDVHVHLAEIYYAKDDLTQAATALKEAGVIIAQWEKDRREVDKDVRTRYDELKEQVEMKRKTAENGIK